MALKLDDFLTKKKEPAQVLDLSKATANTKEEFKRLLEKVPEYKIRPEKVSSWHIQLFNRLHNSNVWTLAVGGRSGFYQQTFQHNKNHPRCLKLELKAFLPSKAFYNVGKFVASNWETIA